MYCPDCLEPWIPIGNEYAGAFQEYEQQCQCEVEPISEEIKNEQNNTLYEYNSF